MWPIVTLAWTWLGLAHATPAAQKVELPFQERFDSADLADSWTKKLSPRATIEVKDGWATFVAPAGGRSHLGRPAGTDLVAISGRLARWAAVYIVWDADHWCGVGKLSPTPFGRIYSIDVDDGKATEVHHRGIDFNAPHSVRVRLGSDHVAFQYQLDGKWIDLRVIERPKGFAGAPKLVAAGIAYGADDKPFGGTSSATGGENHSGAIDELRIEATPAAESKLTPAQLRAIRHPPEEPVNALLRQRADDPTFDEIAGLYPPFRYPREVVGVPEHPDEIGVDHLGRLDASPWAPPRAWFLVGDPPEPFGQLGVPFRRHLRHGYLPLVTLSREIRGVEHELTVFGWSEGFSVTKPTYAYARIIARARDHSPLPKQAVLAWGDGDRHRVVTLQPRGDRAEGCLRFRWPEPATVREIGPSELEAKEQETATHWQQRLALSARFDLPERRVMEAYRAWIAYSLLDGDTINGHLEPHDGSGFYESMFGNSVSLHAVAMDLYGLHEYAAKILDTQCRGQRPDGLYVQDCGLVDPGAFLTGLATHYALTGDRDWLRRVAPHLIRQGDWILRMRRAAPQEGMLRGLIRFRPYNDYPEPVYNYVGNAWCAQGLKLAAAALREIDAPESGRFAAEAEHYRKDILESMQAAAVPRDGATLLPMEPDTHRLLKLSQYRGGGYWGLNASPLLGTGLLAPDDPRTSWIVDHLERRGGLIAGVCEFHEGIDHAYTFGYLNNALKRDEVRKALLGFWSSLAFGMTRETYSPVEVSMIATGENHLTLPHLYSCTEQLRLLRNLLLREDGDVLWLGQGIPRAWLRPGQHVAVNSAPTEFGDVSYRIDADADGTMRARLDPPTRHAPTEIRLRLRHPDGHPIASVRATPNVELESSGETVVLKELKTPVDLEVRFRPDGGRGQIPGD